MEKSNIYGYIYLAENNITGQKYVGKHKYPKIELDPKYKGSGIIFNRALKKYGIENFSYSLVDIAYTLKSLNELEKYWINYYNTYENPIHYNMSPGGDGGKLVKEPWNKNKKNCYTVEQQKRMNDGIKKYINSLTKEERKIKYGQHNKGHTKEKYDGKNCKLTPSIVLNIIEDFKEPRCTRQMLCDKYNLGIGTIEKIIQGETWYHTTGIDKNNWKDYWNKNKKILITKEMQNKIQEYIDKGYGQQKIADILGLTRRIVSSYINKRIKGNYYVFE